MLRQNKRSPIGPQQLPAAGTDFRSIYATLLDHVLGADPEGILDGYRHQVDKLLG